MSLSFLLPFHVIPCPPRPQGHVEFSLGGKGYFLHGCTWQFKEGPIALWKNKGSPAKVNTVLSLLSILQHSTAPVFLQNTALKVQLKHSTDIGGSWWIGYVKLIRKHLKKLRIGEPSLSYICTYKGSNLRSYLRIGELLGQVSLK